MELFLLFAAIALGVLIVFNLTSTVQRRKKADFEASPGGSQAKDVERNKTDRV